MHCLYNLDCLSTQGQAMVVKMLCFVGQKNSTIVPNDLTQKTKTTLTYYSTQKLGKPKKVAQKQEKYTLLKIKMI